MCHRGHERAHRERRTRRTSHHTHTRHIHRDGAQRHRMRAGRARQARGSWSNLAPHRIGRTQTRLDLMKVGPAWAGSNSFLFAVFLGAKRLIRACFCGSQ